MENKEKTSKPGKVFKAFCLFAILTFASGISACRHYSGGRRPPHHPRIPSHPSDFGRGHPDKRDIRKPSHRPDKNRDHDRRGPGKRYSSVVDGAIIVIAAEGNVRT